MSYLFTAAIRCRSLSGTLVEASTLNANPFGRETLIEIMPSRLGRVETGAWATEASASTTAPRSGTKIDNVVKMLGRSEGATLEAIIKATGWLPHSTYAALTGLRKRGYALERSRDDKGDPSVYRLAPPRQTSA